jgi:RNA polymerase sigma-70 factor (ECF subfamily)
VACLDAVVNSSGAQLQELEWMEELRRGEERAYEALLARYEKPVFNLVSRLLPDPGDAPDVTQEVFLKVFRSVGSFRGDSSLKTWIYRIAVNEAHNHRRWFARRQGMEVGLDDEPVAGLCLVDSLAAAEASPFQLAASAETRAALEASLASLKPAFRVAVVLSDVEGMSYEEIAAVLDTKLGTVKSRIVRGREALRKEFEARTGAPRRDWELQAAG